MRRFPMKWNLFLSWHFITAITTSVESATDIIPFSHFIVSKSPLSVCQNSLLLRSHFVLFSFLNTTRAPKLSTSRSILLKNLMNIPVFFNLIRHWSTMTVPLVRVTQVEPDSLSLLLPRSMMVERWNSILESRWGYSWPSLYSFLYWYWSTNGIPCVWWVSVKTELIFAILLSFRSIIVNCSNIISLVSFNKELINPLSYSLVQIDTGQLM